MTRFFTCMFLMMFLAAPAQAGQEKLAVIELFTTAGCSNCPPADAVLKKVVEEYEGNVIALGCHVTYFDRETFRDPISLEECNKRQEEYRRAKVSTRMYTPQMIINGVHDNKGNNEPLVWSGLRMVQATADIKPIEMNIKDGYLDIALPQIALDNPVDLTLFGYDRLHTVRIGGGEGDTDIIDEEWSRSITVDYVNGVRHIRRFMPWDGQKTKMALPLESLPGDAGYALIAQFSDSKEIIAAGKAEH